jgi:hypothetical protein
MVLPPSLIEKEGIVLWGQNVFPSKYFNIVGDGINVREPRPFQYVIGIMHVEASSSTTVLQIADSL